MSVEIIYDPESEQAALFCNSSGWAFGHIFSRVHQNGWDLDAKEAAEGFLTWHQDNYQTDPRKISEPTFQGRFLDWSAAFSEDIESEEVCSECESPYHRTTHCPQRD